MDTPTTTSSVTPVRRAQSIMGRFNPLRNVTPQSVVRYIEDFRRGFLREATWAMECVEETDYTLQSVAPKRKKSVSRLSWDIVAEEGAEKKYGADMIKRQREALLGFYNHITVTHALDRNKRGRLSLLIRQMQDAVGKRYSVHEIAWKPQSDGTLSAEFTFVPLWFFENRTGELRFLAQEGAYEGTPLAPKQWLVHTGDGLMLACMVAYIFKTLPLKDWLTFCERNGMPAFIGKTDAAFGSEDWQNMVQMVQDLAAEFAGVTSTTAAIEVIDLKGGASETVYSAMVERMDRALASLWRGADLSTMSGNDQQGASLQQGETDILEDDDVEAITETLKTQVDAVVLDWIFGPQTPHLVYFQLQAPDRVDQTALLANVASAVNLGAQIPVSWLHEQTGFPQAAPNDDGTMPAVLKPATSQPAAGLPAQGMSAAANAAQETREVEIAAMQRAQDNDLKPLSAALARVQAAETVEDINAALTEAYELIEKRALHMVMGSQLASVLETLAAQSLVAGAMSQENALQQATK